MSVQIGLGSLDGRLGHLPRFVLIVSIISNILIIEQMHIFCYIFLDNCKASNLCTIFISGCAEWFVDSFWGYQQSTIWFTLHINAFIGRGCFICNRTWGGGYFTLQPAWLICKLLEFNLLYIVFASLEGIVLEVIISLSPLLSLLATTCMPVSTTIFIITVHTASLSWLVAPTVAHSHITKWAGIRN